MGKWTFSTKIYAGLDSLDRLYKLCGETILVVSDPFLKDSSDLSNILNKLKESNNVNLYTDVIPDPPITHVVKGVEHYMTVKPTVMIVIGGGSAIDLSKAIKYFAHCIYQCELKQFIAIPTTSGTGSEVTSFAVITDSKAGVKYPLVDESLLPTEAILTPLFVKSAPLKVTAYSGMDVLAHALEALVALKADNFTDALAKQVVVLVFNNLRECASVSPSIDARMNMHEASCMAGLAFNKAGLGITHAMAHQLGGQFHIPHGLANSILLPKVILYNGLRSPKAMKKYAEMAMVLGIANKNMSDEEKLAALSVAVTKLAKDINCPLSITECNVSKNDLIEKLPILVSNALKDMTYTTNPYKATAEDLTNIYNLVI